MKQLYRHLTAATLAGALMMTGAAPLQADSAGSGHETVSCGRCHQGGARLAATGYLPVSRQCLECHGGPGISAGQFHLKASGRCLECHQFHAPEQITMPGGSPATAANVSPQSAPCRSCHDPRGRLGDLSPAHRKAADLYHEQASQLQATSPSETCLRCHDAGSSSPWQAAAPGRTLTFNTHASHPYSVKVVPGQGNSTNWIAAQIDQRIPLFDGKMECQSCHLLTAGAKDLLIPFETKYELCRGCHRHAGDEERRSPQVLTAVINR